MGLVSSRRRIGLTWHNHGSNGIPCQNNAIFFAYVILNNVADPFLYFHSPTPSSGTLPVTCVSGSTPTPLSCRSATPVAKAVGLFYLSSHPSKIPKNLNPPLNGPIYLLCRIMKMVLSSTVEAEYGGLFINSKEGVPIRTTLQGLGHKQPKPERLSKQITPQRTVLYTITYAKRNHVVLKRDSIGSVIVPSKANSTYTGNQAQTTNRIMPPNTTPLPYTEKCV